MFRIKNSHQSEPKIHYQIEIRDNNRIYHQSLSFEKYAIKQTTKKNCNDLLALDLFIYDFINCSFYSNRPYNVV